MVNNSLNPENNVAEISSENHSVRLQADSGSDEQNSNACKC